MPPQDAKAAMEKYNQKTKPKPSWMYVLLFKKKKKKKLWSIVSRTLR
jgi:hypothetical protein